MSGEEVIEIINTICDKVGIVVENVSDLIPSFAIHGIITNGIPCVLSVLLLIAAVAYFIVFIMVCLNFSKNRESVSWNDDWVFVPGIIGLGMGVVSVIAIFYFEGYIQSFLGWWLAPEAEMVYEVLRMI